MTLCKTLLAAYACAYQYGSQNSMSSAPSIDATLIGAAGAEYTISIPADMSVVYTNDVLSISHIKTTGGSCTFCGIDGAEVLTQFLGPGAVNLDDKVDVGPPQTIVYAVCT